MVKYLVESLVMDIVLEMMTAQSSSMVAMKALRMDRNFAQQMVFLMAMMLDLLMKVLMTVSGILLVVMMVP